MKNKLFVGRWIYFRTDKYLCLCREGIGRDGNRLLLFAGFVAGIKFYENFAFTARRYRAAGPVRNGTTAGRARIADQQRDVARIGEGKRMAQHGTFVYGTKIVRWLVKAYACELIGINGTIAGNGVAHKIRIGYLSVNACSFVTTANAAVGSRGLAGSQQTDAGECCVKKS